MPDDNAPQNIEETERAALWRHIQRLKQHCAALEQAVRKIARSDSGDACADLDAAAEARNA